MTASTILVLVKTVLQIIKRWSEETTTSSIPMGLAQTIVWLDGYDNADEFPNGELIVTYTHTKKAGSNKVIHVLCITIKQAVYSYENMEKRVERTIELRSETWVHIRKEIESLVEQVLTKTVGINLPFPDPIDRPDITKVMIHPSSPGSFGRPRTTQGGYGDQ